MTPAASRVWLEPGWGPSYDFLNFEALSMRAAGLFRTVHGSDWNPKLTLPEELNARYRIFAGQTDPHDRSHFTIQLQAIAYSKTQPPTIIIDGWLLDDLSIKLSDRPATAQ